jgi:hypothetical protein
MHVSAGLKAGVGKARSEGVARVACRAELRIGVAVDGLAGWELGALGQQNDGDGDGQEHRGGCEGADV